MVLPPPPDEDYVYVHPAGGEATETRRDLGSPFVFKESLSGEHNASTAEDWLRPHSFSASPD